jgi:plasmid stabilization system protein ParE
MRFTVTWHPAAEAELAEIWLRAHDRASVTRATSEIDQALSAKPLVEGEEFYGDRILVSPPLAVTYSVSEQDRLVQILQVWHPSLAGDDAEQSPG